MTKESPRDAGRLAFTERMPSAQSRKLRQVIHGTVHIALVVGQRDRGSGFELRRNPPQGHVVLFRAVVDEQLAQLPALVAAEAQCLGDTTERRMGDSATSGLGLELGELGQDRLRVQRRRRLVLEAGGLGASTAPPARSRRGSGR